MSSLPAPRPLTYREARYITKVMLESKTRSQAMRELGFPPGLCEHPGFIERPEILAEMERIRGELVANTIEQGLADATEIHEYLTDCFRADMRDIRNDDGTYKPQSEWPDIWGRMMEAGDVEVSYSSERSHDGQDKDKQGGWDTVGKVISVKLKFSKRNEIVKMLMSHKAVDAVAAQKQDVAIKLTVTAEEQREMAAAERRRSKIIDVKAEES